MTGAALAVPPIELGAGDWAEVKRILRSHVSETEVWAFGSRARRTAKPYSDLDLAIIAAAPLTLRELADLADAFDTSDLPFKVDLVDWATAGEAFRNNILRDRVVVQPPGPRTTAPPA